MKGDNYVTYGNYIQRELFESIDKSLFTFTDLKLNRLKGNFQEPRLLEDNLLGGIIKWLKL